MVGALWRLAAVVTPAGTIGQIVEQDVSAGLQEAVEGASASVDATFTGVMEGKPMISFTTTDLATALGYCGINALAIATNCDFYFAQLTQGAAISSTGALKVTATKGILIPRMLEAAQGQVAKITYEMHPVSPNGSTAPLAITTGNALPVQGGVTNLYTLGMVKLNTVAFSSVQSVRWDFGMPPEVVGSDGEGYPTFAGVNLRRPVAAMNGLDLTGLSTYTLLGTPLTAWITYFRNLASGGVRVPDATASHIKLNGTTGMIYPRGARGPYNKPLEGEWNLVPTFDATHDVIQINTGSAVV